MIHSIQKQFIVIFLLSVVVIDAQFALPTFQAVNSQDWTGPRITITAIASDNSTIAVTFSEAVYNTSGGSGTLEVADFTLSISGGSATLASTTPSSISVSSNTYTLGISLSGTANGSETLTVSPVDDSIYDAAGNEASTSQSNNTASLIQLSPPLFSAISLASNNSTVAITFNEAVYNTNGGSGSLEAADFSFAISGGTATLASSTPSSISASSNTYTLGISLSGTPDGTEFLFVYPVDDGIYDAAGSEAAINQSFNTILLNDVSGPTMAITGENGGGTSVADGATTSDNPLTMTFTASEPTSDFVVGDITVSGGSLSSFSASSTTITQLGSDIDGEATGDYSGTSVSMDSDGDRVAIGAYYNRGNGSRAGHVRIYEWGGSSWSQMGNDIDGEDIIDYSGYSVSLDSDGDRVAIGAHGNDGSASNAGHVRIYEWGGSSWSRMGSDIDGEAAGDLSGKSVSLDSDGDRVAIGASTNDGNGSDAGHVRI